MKRARCAWSARTLLGLAGAIVSLAGACGGSVLTSGAASGCTRGTTRTCRGPGACRGGQSCGASGQWSACDCGSGGSGPTGATGGSAGTGAGPVTDASTCPSTCAELGADCGSVPDIRCGGTVQCGTCAAGETCGAGGPNKCGGAAGTCDPNFCPPDPNGGAGCCLTPNGPCGVDRGSGCQGTCSSAACTNSNGPTCCVSADGPCGLISPQGACVPDPCYHPVTLCARCLCKTCSAELDKCAVYGGCNLIVGCMLKVACSGLDCYTPQTCQAVIDQNGGLSGPQYAVAQGLLACEQQNSCTCP